VISYSDCLEKQAPRYKKCKKCKERFKCWSSRDIEYVFDMNSVAGSVLIDKDGITIAKQIFSTPIACVDGDSITVTWSIKVK